MPGGLDRNSTGSPLRAELHALVDARQEAAAPEVLPPRPAAGDEHDEGRQVLRSRVPRP